MAAVAAVFLAVLALGVGGGLVLYLLVRAEHDKRKTMDRRDAERAARRDSETTRRDAGRTAGGDTGWTTHRDDDRRR
ncbi:MAG: hypothetical protein V5A30_10980 [Haloarculaceae archaeon]